VRGGKVKLKTKKQQRKEAWIKELEHWFIVSKRTVLGAESPVNLATVALSELENICRKIKKDMQESEPANDGH
jgi:hypothetical protein